MYIAKYRRCFFSIIAFIYWLYLCNIF